MTEIVTVTMNPAIDKSVSIDRVVPEQKLRCSKPTFDPGGGGVNVSRAAHKLGSRSTVYYTSGGTQGRFLGALLEAEGLDHRPMPIQGRTRENFIVDETDTGQQYRFGAPGPELSHEEGERCMEAVFSGSPKPDLFVVSGSMPPGLPADFCRRIVRRANAAGAKVILDVSGEPFRDGVEEGVFLIKPNLGEFRRLVGDPLEDEDHQMAAAERLVAEGRSEIVVISLGAAGALRTWRGGCERLRAPTVTIRSKVGAGDSMVGGIVAYLAEGADPVDAVQYGVAAGAAAVMTPGTALCRLDDTRRLYQRIADERSRQPCRNP